jgi:Domain of unknown function (DUF5710)
VSRAWLDVPYSEHQQAKSAGARWDQAARRWYAPRPQLGCGGLDRGGGRRPQCPLLIAAEDQRGQLLAARVRQDTD